MQGSEKEPLVRNNRPVYKAVTGTNLGSGNSGSQRGCCCKQGKECFLYYANGEPDEEPLKRVARRIFRKVLEQHWGEAVAKKVQRWLDQEGLASDAKGAIPLQSKSPITLIEWLQETALQTEMEESGSSRSKLLPRRGSAAEDEHLRVSGLKRLRALRKRLEKQPSYTTTDAPMIDIYMQKAVFCLFLGRDSQDKLSLDVAEEALERVMGDRVPTRVRLEEIFAAEAIKAHPPESFSTASTTQPQISLQRFLDVCHLVAKDIRR